MSCELARVMIKITDRINKETSEFHEDKGCFIIPRLFNNFKRFLLVSQRYKIKSTSFYSAQNVFILFLGMIQANIVYISIINNLQQSLLVSKFRNKIQKTSLVIALVVLSKVLLSV